LYPNEKNNDRNKQWNIEPKKIHLNTKEGPNGTEVPLARAAYV